MFNHRPVIINRPVRGKNGFTILEVLLSVTIISVILVSIYSTFWGGIRLSERTENSTGVFREIRLAFDLMKQDFENMIPYDFSNSYSEKSALSGDETQAVLILETPEGLKAVRYSLDEEAVTKIHQVIIGNHYKKNVAVNNQNTEEARASFLIRQEIPFIEYLQGRESSAGWEIIAEHVRKNSLKFSYGFYPQDNSEQLVWVSQWRQKNLPVRLKVSMDFLSAQKDQRIISLSRDIYIPTGNPP